MMKVMPQLDSQERKKEKKKNRQTERIKVRFIEFKKIDRKGIKDTKLGKDEDREKETEKENDR